MKNSILKVAKHIYISYFTFLIIIFAYLSKNFNHFCILYSIVFIHEMFHLIAAKINGIKIRGIFIMPYGISLKLNNTHISEPRKEIYIAAAGPFANIIMIIAALLIQGILKLGLGDVTFFIFANLAVCVINMIPVLPLDGGRILKAILINAWGFKKAFAVMENITKILLLILIFLGFYILYLTRLNYSIILICVFLLFNIVAERKISKLVTMKAITDNRKKLTQKGIVKANMISVLDNVYGSKILNHLSYNYLLIIIVIDSNMNITGIISEVQLVEGLAKLGSNAKIKDILAIASELS